MKMLKLQSEGDPKVVLWYKGKNINLLHHRIQNELIKVMGLCLLRTVVSFIQQAQFFTILADETTDCANREQLVFTNRWVDDNLEVHEEFRSGSENVREL